MLSCVLALYTFQIPQNSVTAFAFLLLTKRYTTSQSLSELHAHFPGLPSKEAAIRSSQSLLLSHLSYLNCG